MKMILNPVMVPVFFALGTMLMLEKALHSVTGEDSRMDMLPSSPPKDHTIPPQAYAARRGVFRK